MPIDKGIIDIVTSLNALNCHTTASCEGHLSWGCANPWIDIDSQKDISDLEEECSQLYQKITEEESNLTDEEESILWKKYHQLTAKASQPGLKERLKLATLLNEFYKNHQASWDTQLNINNLGLSTSRLESNGAQLQDIRSKKERAEKLKAYQKEMQAFGEFLQEKFTKKFTETITKFPQTKTKTKTKTSAN